jgi:hypothetical protein
VIFLRTDNELKDALAKLAEIEQISQREVIRRAVLDRLRRLNHENQVEEASVRVIMRWEDVLDRLGRA